MMVSISFLHVIWENMRYKTQSDKTGPFLYSAETLSFPRYILLPFEGPICVLSSRGMSGVSNDRFWCNVLHAHWMLVVMETQFRMRIVSELELYLCSNEGGWLSNYSYKKICCHATSPFCLLASDFALSQARCNHFHLSEYTSIAELREFWRGYRVNIMDEFRKKLILKIVG
jgi:hypothetical protein